MELFYRRLWPAEICRTYLNNRYHHLIFDNIEEDVPLAHDFTCQWLPDLESACLIYDTEAGYRLFLGADPDGAYRLKDACPQKFELKNSLVCSPPLQALSRGAALALDRPSGDEQPLGIISSPTETCLTAKRSRYYPEMLDYVAAEIEKLIFEEGVPPGEIAVLTPFLGDALRFNLAYRMAGQQIPMRTQTAFPRFAG